MPYTPGGYPYDGSSLPGNLESGDQIDVAAWNAFISRMGQSGNAHVAADYRGLRNMSGGEPEPAASGDVRDWAKEGEHYLSRDGRPPRRTHWDRSLEEFGAVGDGVADDTAAWQDALDWGFSEVEASHVPRLMVPPLAYAISDTLVWRGNSAQAVSIIGQLHRADGYDDLHPRLLWYGSDNATMMYAEAANAGLIRDLVFLGRNKAGILLHLAASSFADPAILKATNGIRLQHVKFKGVKIATTGNGCVAVGTDPALTGGDTFQQSDVAFEHCYFIGEDTGAPGFTYAGMKAYGVRMLSGGNCKLLSFFRPNFGTCNYALDLENSSGPITVEILQVGDCRFAIRHNSGALLVNGGDIECSHVDDFRLLVGSGGVGGSAILRGLEVAGYMSGAVGTLLEGGGHVTIEDCYLCNNNYSVSGDSDFPNPFKVFSNAVPGITNYGSFTSKRNWYRNCGTAARPYIPIYDGSANDCAPVDGAYGATVELAISSEHDTGGPTTGSLIPFRSFDSRKKKLWQLELNALMPVTAVAVGTTAYEAQVRRATTKVTLPYTAFQAAAVTKDISLGTFAPGTYLRKVRAEVTTAFAGTAGTLQLKCGIGAGDGKVWGNKDVKSGVVSIGDAAADYATATGMGDELALGYCPDKAATYILSTRLTSGSGNLSGLNAGSVTFYLEYELP